MTVLQIPSLSRELQFVAACCRWPQSGAARIAVHEAASRITDWDKLLQVCRRHRVAGLVHQAISNQTEIPAEFSAKIKRAAQIIAVNAARQARDAVWLEQQMGQNGIRSVQFKGPSLSQMAYGSLAIKRSKDLDILVAPSDIPAALGLLIKSGYRINGVEKSVSEVLSNALIRHRNQIELFNSQGMIIELHWQLANAPGLLPDIERQLSTQSVVLTGHGTVSTLGDVDLFAYLCQHGALHDWARLRWLADVAALFFASCPEITEPLMQAAHDKGAGLAAEQAQLLCHHLFATPAPRNISARAQHLTQYALRRIEAPYTRSQIWAEVSFIARRWWVQRHFYSNTIAALGLLKVHRASLDDIVAMPLPAHFDWLYPIMRIPRWLGRRFTRVTPPPTK